MPTPSLGTILAAIQTEATAAGVRFAPTYLPDSPPPGIVSAVWVNNCAWELYGTEVRLVGGVISASFLTAHDDLKRNLEVMIPFLVGFPAQLHANPRLSQDQDIFRSISARYVAEDWAGVPMVGYQFDIVFDLVYH